jgi:hypothetical protein
MFMGGGMVKSNPSEVYFGGPHANMVKLKRKKLVSNLNLIQLFEKNYTPAHPLPVHNSFSSSFSSLASCYSSITNIIFSSTSSLYNSNSSNNVSRPWSLPSFPSSSSCFSR